MLFQNERFDDEIEELRELFYDIIKVILIEKYVQFSQIVQRIFQLE